MNPNHDKIRLERMREKYDRYHREGCYLGDIAKLFNRDRLTIRKKVEPIKEDLGRENFRGLLSVREVKLIFEYLGNPFEKH